MLDPTSLLGSGIPMNYAYSSIVETYTESIGVRDLREQLSANLELVGKGGTIIVTDHGKPVAKIVPYLGASKLQELLDSGVAILPKRVGPIEWEPPIVPTPGPPISRLLMDDRED